MPSPVGLTGIQQFGNLSKALKAAGGSYRKNLLRDIQKATAPAKRLIPESALVTLPRRGGLNERVASSLKVTTRTSLSGMEARVRITATEGPRRHITDLDRGKVRKPLFGDRGHWYSQSVQPGFFSRPCLSLRPMARRAVVESTNRTLRSIVT